eukprot:TRINITY_DN50035_c0_g1_i1.p1 TRINITY_DN50035_c0_g1~~TRINITY_DN50035_c0_g1_i1.p1  ORF type:complete len:412 (+),score=199.78 TRINITY_DN50035_c0_g1_i1:81-1316(+)
MSSPPTPVSPGSLPPVGQGGLSASAAQAAEHVLQSRLFREQRSKAIYDYRVRMHDPKQRSYGIDKAALDEQVREKQAMKAQQKAEEQYYAEQALLQDKYAKWLEQEQKKQEIERELEAANFRREKQKPSQRREADLNDKHRMRKELPPRVGDNDPRCTISGCQRFEGEDLDHLQRRKGQAEQFSRWADQQIAEKNLKKQLERDTQMLGAERTEQVTHKAWACERLVEQRRTEIAQSTAEFNKKLAAQKERERLADKHYEQKCNLQEIQNMLDSDFLSEDRRVTVNPASSGRSCGTGPAYRRDNMKGLDPVQRSQIFAEQAAQREELAAKRKAEKEMQLQADLQEEQERRMSIALDRQRERERRAHRRSLFEERKAQAQEAAQKRANLDELYKNRIDDEWYAFSLPRPNGTL